MQASLLVTTQNLDPQTHTDGTWGIDGRGRSHSAKIAFAFGALRLLASKFYLKFEVKSMDS